MQNLEKTWGALLSGELKKPYIRDLQNFLEREKSSGGAIYPPEPLLFHAFAQTPTDKVKVVIVGQDPYHGPGQAHGLAFSVPCGIPQPPSLKNIFRELHNDLQIAPPRSGCLEGWAEQGVLLLNTTLTVRAGAPRSHFGRGWERFTDAVLAALAERKNPLVFLLWGRSAQEKGALLTGPHLILQAAHPSPYSASRGFFGCRHFSKANEALRGWGERPIEWNCVNSSAHLYSLSKN